MLAPTFLLKLNDSYTRGFVPSSRLNKDGNCFHVSIGLTVEKTVSSSCAESLFSDKNGHTNYNIYFLKTNYMSHYKIFEIIYNVVITAL